MAEAAFGSLYPAALRAATLHACRRWRPADGPLDFRQDLIQEALVEVWSKATRYDSRRASWPTFCDRVAVGRIRTVMRSERAARRRLVAHHEALHDHGAVDDHRELRADVGRVLRTVSPFDRAVALSLSEYSVSETGKRFGIARSTVYEAVYRLRDAFSRAGLRPHQTGIRGHGSAADGGR